MPNNDALVNILFSNIDSLNNYDINVFDSKLNTYTEDGDTFINNLKASMDNNPYSKEFSLLKSKLSEVTDSLYKTREVNKFFTNIKDYIKLENLPITIAVEDTDIVDSVNPQYLSQFINNITINIQSVIDGKNNYETLQSSYLSNDYLVTMKKSLVKTLIPYELDNTELYTYQNKKIVTVNKEFIISVLLPFTSYLSSYIEKTTELIKDTNKVINDNEVTINNIMSAMSSLEELDSDTLRDIERYVYESIRMYKTLVYYTIYMIMKKLSSMQFDIDAYYSLRQKLLSFHPEGSRVMHEHVLDGNPEDVDSTNTLSRVLNGDYSVFKAILDNLYHTYKYNMANNTDINVFTSMNKTDEYDRDIYIVLNKLFLIINYGLETLNSLSDKDMISTSDVLIKSDLDKPLSETYSDVISRLSDIDLYKDNSDVRNPLGSAKIYLSMLNELDIARTSMYEIVKSIYNTFNNYLNIKENLIGKLNNIEYNNQEKIKELCNRLNSFNSEYREFVNNITNTMINRYRDISNLLDNLESTIFKSKELFTLNLNNPDTDNTLNNALIESYSNMCKIDMDYILESRMGEYSRLRNLHEFGITLFEDGDNLATNANQSNTNNNSNTTTNTNTSNNNTNSGSTDTNVKGALDKLITTITNFFQKAVNSIRGVVEKQKGNVSWLNDKANDILNKVNYNNVNISIVPYDKYFKADELLNNMNDLDNKIKSITVDQIKNTFNGNRDALNSYLFSFIDNGLLQSNLGNFFPFLKTYYKTKGKKVEAIPYKGAEVKQVAEFAINYCKSYYTDYSDKVLKASENIKNSLNNKITALTDDVMKESVDLFLEDTNTNNNQNTNNNANQNKSNNNNNQNKGNNKGNNKGGNKSNVGNTKVQVNATDDNGNKVDTKTNTKATTTYVKVFRDLASSVENYTASVLNTTKDINFDYLQLLDGLYKLIGNKSGDNNVEVNNNENKENTNTDNSNNTENTNNNQNNNSNNNQNANNKK